MNDQLRAAVVLTTAQLEQAIEIVEAEFGADPDGRYVGLVSAALLAIATNYAAAR
jgi:hypothetical protein